MIEKKGFHQDLPKEVITQAQSGSPIALQSIYQTYGEACYNLAVRICGNKYLSQDIVQESFITIINKISQFNHSGSFAGWVRRITANETINRIRAETKLYLVDDFKTESLESNDLFGIEWLNANLDLNILLNQLSTTQRAVLILHELDGFTHKEIAKMFDNSESFSKTTLSRAYSHLKELALKTQNNQGVANAFIR